MNYHIGELVRGLIFAALLCCAEIPTAALAQSFVPAPMGTVNGAVPYQGIVAGPNTTSSMYFMGKVGTTYLAPGSQFDAFMWWYRWTPVPDRWVAGGNGTISQCPPNMGDTWRIIIAVPLPGGPEHFSMSGGTYCLSYFDPEYITAFHYAGQPNGPVYRPDMPAEAPCPAVACSGAPFERLCGWAF